MARQKHGPEWHIQRRLKQFLKIRGWLVQQTHGNLFQKGFPDLFLAHRTLGHRWVDVKVDGHYQFTRAQRQTWPVWDDFGVGIWILTDATQAEYDKLFAPPNWRDYWKPGYEPVDIESLLKELDAEADQT